MANTREKLIELLTAYFGVDPAYYGIEAAHLADHLISHGVTIQEWISVKDRLPDTFGEYLVAVQAYEEEAGNLYTDYADYDPYAKRWKTGLPFCAKDKVTHWMPLPTPPKGE